MFGVSFYVPPAWTLLVLCAALVGVACVLVAVASSRINLLETDEHEPEPVSPHRPVWVEPRTGARVDAPEDTRRLPGVAVFPVRGGAEAGRRHVHASGTRQDWRGDAHTAARRQRLAELQRVYALMRRVK